MKPRRAFAKFKPDDRPKALPPPGHPDWDEYEPPTRNRPARELTFHESVLAWVIQRALRDTGGGYYPEVREDAYTWLMCEDDEQPGTFSWMCEILGLRMENVIATWESKHGKIQRPTAADKAFWLRRDARNRATRYSRINHRRARIRAQNVLDNVVSAS